MSKALTRLIASIGVAGMMTQNVLAADGEITFLNTDPLEAYEASTSCAKRKITEFFADNEGTYKDYYKISFQTEGADYINHTIGSDKASLNAFVKRDGKRITDVFLTYAGDADAVKSLSDIPSFNYEVMGHLGYHEDMADLFGKLAIDNIQGKGDFPIAEKTIELDAYLRQCSLEQRFGGTIRGLNR